jgi:uncharacterized membrane protein (DUF2068 family)
MQQLGIKHGSNLRQRRVLRAVAGFELFKGIFVLLMGICALALVHKDVWLYAESLLAVFHINTDRHSAQLFLTFADSVTDARLWAAARIAFAYAVLRFTEGYGLWQGRTWAEWVAFVSGTLLLPLEVRELFRGVTAIRCLLLAGNVTLVLYMLYVIMSNRKQRQQEVAKEPSLIEMPRRDRLNPSKSGATPTPVPKSEKLDSL